MMDADNHRFFRGFYSGAAVLVAAVMLFTSYQLADADERSGSAPTYASTSGEDAPVLVELFTSQGCSSCPPADRLLGQLATAEGDGPTVIPLSFHVDYWNYIGWKDPFSSEEWSLRQSDYATAFDSSRVYTPQLVINGRRDCVGSNEKRVRDEIARAAQERQAGRLDFELRATEGQGLRLAIDAHVDDASSTGQAWSVMVAVFENSLETPVSRGENGGRTLRNNHVVRSLTEAFTLPVEAGAQRSEELQLQLENSWNREHLGVAVFLQDPETRHIHGAAVRYLST